MRDFVEEDLILQDPRVERFGHALLSSLIQIFELQSSLCTRSL